MYLTHSEVHARQQKMHIGKLRRFYRFWTGQDCGEYKWSRHQEKKAALAVVCTVIGITAIFQDVM